MSSNPPTTAPLESATTSSASSSNAPIGSSVSASSTGQMNPSTLVAATSAASSSTPTTATPAARSSTMALSSKQSIPIVARSTSTSGPNAKILAARARQKALQSTLRATLAQAIQVNEQSAEAFEKPSMVLGTSSTTSASSQPTTSAEAKSAAAVTKEREKEPQSRTPSIHRQQQPPSKLTDDMRKPSQSYPSTPADPSKPKLDDSSRKQSVSHPSSPADPNNANARPKLDDSNRKQSVSQPATPNFNNDHHLRLEIREPSTADLFSPSQTTTPRAAGVSAGPTPAVTPSAASRSSVTFAAPSGAVPSQTTARSSTFTRPPTRTGRSAILLSPRANQLKFSPAGTLLTPLSQADLAAGAATASSSGGSGVALAATTSPLSKSSAASSTTSPSAARGSQLSPSSITATGGTNLTPASTTRKIIKQHHTIHPGMAAKHLAASALNKPGAHQHLVTHEHQHALHHHAVHGLAPAIAPAPSAQHRHHRSSSANSLSFSSASGSLTPSLSPSTSTHHHVAFAPAAVGAPSHRLGQHAHGMPHGHLPQHERRTSRVDLGAFTHATMRTPPSTAGPGGGHERRLSRGDLTSFGHGTMRTPPPMIPGHERRLSRAGSRAQTMRPSDIAALKAAAAMAAAKAMEDSSGDSDDEESSDDDDDDTSARSAEKDAKAVHAHVLKQPKISSTSSSGGHQEDESASKKTMSRLVRLEQRERKQEEAAAAAQAAATAAAEQEEETLGLDVRGGVTILDSHGQPLPVQRRRGLSGGQWDSMYHLLQSGQTMSQKDSAAAANTPHSLSNTMMAGNAFVLPEGPMSTIVGMENVPGTFPITSTDATAAGDGASGGGDGDGDKQPPTSASITVPIPKLKKPKRRDWWATNLGPKPRQREAHGRFQLWGTGILYFLAIVLQLCSLWSDDWIEDNSTGLGVQDKDLLQWLCLGFGVCIGALGYTCLMFRFHGFSIAENGYKVFAFLCLVIQGVLGTTATTLYEQDHREEVEKSNELLIFGASYNFCILSRAYIAVCILLLIWQELSEFRSRHRARRLSTCLARLRELRIQALEHDPQGDCAIPHAQTVLNEVTRLGLSAASASRLLAAYRDGALPSAASTSALIETLWTDKDYLSRGQRRLVWISNVFFCVIFFGGLFYAELETWNPRASIDFAIVSLTTIGYGNTAPRTDLGKIFMYVYFPLGFAVVGYTVQTWWKVVLFKLDHRVSWVSSWISRKLQERKDEKEIRKRLKEERQKELDEKVKIALQLDDTGMDASTSPYAYASSHHPLDDDLQSSHAGHPQRSTSRSGPGEEDEDERENNNEDNEDNANEDEEQDDDDDSYNNRSDLINLERSRSSRGLRHDPDAGCGTESEEEREPSKSGTERSKTHSKQSRKSISRSAPSQSRTRSQSKSAAAKFLSDGHKPSMEFVANPLATTVTPSHSAHPSIGMVTPGHSTHPSTAVSADEVRVHVLVDTQDAHGQSTGSVPLFPAGAATASNSPPPPPPSPPAVSPPPSSSGTNGRGNSPQPRYSTMVYRANGGSGGMQQSEPFDVSSPDAAKILATSLSPNRSSLSGATLSPAQAKLLAGASPRSSLLSVNTLGGVSPRASMTLSPKILSASPSPNRGSLIQLSPDALATAKILAAGSSPKQPSTGGADGDLGMSPEPDIHGEVGPDDLAPRNDVAELLGSPTLALVSKPPKKDGLEDGDFNHPEDDDHDHEHHAHEDHEHDDHEDDHDEHDHDGHEHDQDQEHGEHGPVRKKKKKHASGMTKAAAAQAKEDRKARARQIKLLCALFFSFAWVMFSSAIFARLEGWRYLDAIWFCYITTTTIGYGDYYPSNSATSAFFIWFVIFGLGSITYILTLLTEMMVESAAVVQLAEAKRKAKLKARRAKMKALEAAELELRAQEMEERVEELERSMIYHENMTIQEEEGEYDYDQENEDGEAENNNQDHHPRDQLPPSPKDDQGGSAPHQLVAQSQEQEHSPEVAPTHPSPHPSPRGATHVTVTPVNTTDLIDPSATSSSTSALPSTPSVSNTGVPDAPPLAPPLIPKPAGSPKPSAGANPSPWHGRRMSTVAQASPQALLDCAANFDSCVKKMLELAKQVDSTSSVVTTTVIITPATPSTSSTGASPSPPPAIDPSLLEQLHSAYLALVASEAQRAKVAASVVPSGAGGPQGMFVRAASTSAVVDAHHREDQRAKMLEQIKAFKRMALRKGAAAAVVLGGPPVASFAPGAPLAVRRGSHMLPSKAAMASAISGSASPGGQLSGGASASSKPGVRFGGASVASGTPMKKSPGPDASPAPVVTSSSSEDEESSSSDEGEDRDLDWSRDVGATRRISRLIPEAPPLAPSTTTTLAPTRASIVGPLPQGAFNNPLDMAAAVARALEQKRSAAPPPLTHSGHAHKTSIALNPLGVPAHAHKGSMALTPLQLPHTSHHAPKGSMALNPLSVQAALLQVPGQSQGSHHHAGGSKGHHSASSTSATKSPLGGSSGKHPRPTKKVEYLAPHTGDPEDDVPVSAKSEQFAIPGPFSPSPQPPFSASVHGAASTGSSTPAPVPGSPAPSAPPLVVLSAPAKAKLAQRRGSAMVIGSKPKLAPFAKRVVDDAPVKKGGKKIGWNSMDMFLDRHYEQLEIPAVQECETTITEATSITTSQSVATVPEHEHDDATEHLPTFHEDEPAASSSSSTAPATDKTPSAETKP